MTHRIVKTSISPVGYRIQRISDNVFISPYDLPSLDIAKRQLSAILNSEGKKLKNFINNKINKKSAA